MLGGRGDLARMVVDSVQWFGEPYPSREHPAPIFELADEVPTPVGELCLYCDGPIFENDRGFSMPCGADEDGVIAAPEHFECFVRQIFGSVAHQEKRCTCYGGTGTDDDDGELTRRGSALLAFAEFDRRTRA